MPLPIVTGGLVWDRGSLYQLQTDKVFFELVQGYDAFPEVRGEDDVIPGRAGRDRRNRVDDRLIIELRGWVQGQGASRVARQQDFRASVTALMAQFDPTGDAGTLSVVSPYLGLPSGSDAILCYPLPWMESADMAHYMSFKRFSIELEAVGDPPRWASGGGGGSS